MLVFQDNFPYGGLAMKRKQYSVEQIVAALKQAELGMPVADLIRHLGISEQTYYRWKKQYAGLESNQVRKLKQLQDENERLKRLVTESAWTKRFFAGHCRKKVASPALRRQAVVIPPFLTVVKSRG